MDYFLKLSLFIATYLATIGAAEKLSKAALVIIDVQDCFLSGGSLAVNEGNDVIPVINGLRKELSDRLSMVVVSQDWHCAEHISFASSHVGKKPFDVVQLNYLDRKLCVSSTVNIANFPNAVECNGTTETTKNISQVLWPVHCVKNVIDGPTSSNLDGNLLIDKDDVIVKKGSSCEVDSYSLFLDNGGLKSTGLENTMRTEGITDLFITGLALDYCVYWTALDAKTFGFDVYVVIDATRGVDPKTSEQAKSDMVSKGIRLINSAEVVNIMDASKIGNKGYNNTMSMVNIYLLSLAVIVWLMKE